MFGAAIRSIAVQFSSGDKCRSVVEKMIRDESTKIPTRKDIAFALLIGGVVFAIHWIFRSSNFGHFQDSSLYLGGARAFASGQGYVMGDFFGHPKIGVYTPGWPFILSLVWRLNPAFPDNLPLLQVTELFFMASCAGLGFLIVRMLGAAAWFAGLLTLMWATTLRAHEYTVWLMSDPGFCVLLFILFIAWLTKGTPSSGGWLWALGLTAAASYAWRAAGLGIMLGAGILGLSAAWSRRREPLRAAVCLIGATLPPFIALLAWRFASKGAYSPEHAIRSFFKGGTGLTWFFTERLTDFGNLVIGRIWGEMFCAIFGRIPAVAERHGLVAFWVTRTPVIIISGIITFWLIRGLLRMRGEAWFAPTACMAAAYGVFVVLSPLPSSYLNRYLMPLWPLFVAALWRGLPMAAPGQPLRAIQRAGPVILALALAANVGWLPRAQRHWNNVFAMDELKEASLWIRQSTPPGSKVAIDWALPIVHAGVWTERPLVVDYNHPRWRNNFVGYEQQGMPIADYLITSDQGYQSAEAPAGSTPVFKSAGGHFIVSKLDPVVEAQRLETIRAGKDVQIYWD